MRFMLVVLLPLFACLSSCQRAQVSENNGVEPLESPANDAGDVCGNACASGDLSGSGQDPIEYLAVATDTFGGFFEPVEIKVMGHRVAACTGVRGLALYRAEQACCPSLEASFRPEPSLSYPRCQHLAFVSSDRVVLTNRGDEISPTSFLTVLDIASLAEARTVDTHLGDGETSYEGITIGNGTLYAAKHEKGLEVFSIEGDGKLSSERTVVSGLVNAWQPLVDPETALLYVADAQGVWQCSILLTLPAQNML